MLSAFPKSIGIFRTWGGDYTEKKKKEEEIEDRREMKDEDTATLYHCIQLRFAF